LPTDEIAAKKMQPVETVQVIVLDRLAQGVFGLLSPGVPHPVQIRGYVLVCFSDFATALLRNLFS
jgi:hypothetical protein